MINTNHKIIYDEEKCVGCKLCYKASLTLLDGMKKTRNLYLSMWKIASIVSSALQFVRRTLLQLCLIMKASIYFRKLKGISRR